MFKRFWKWLVGPVVKSGTAVMLLKTEEGPMGSFSVKMLVHKRKGSHGAGIYSYPGGHIDPPDKDLFAAGAREVLEETGVICEPFSPDGYRDDLFTTFRILSDDGMARYTTVYMVARYVSGGDAYIAEDGKDCLRPTEPKKCDRWEWVTIRELEVMVKPEGEKAWLPFDKIDFYLKQLISNKLV